MKQEIQTNLLGVEVVIGEETGTASGPTHEAANAIGIIRNVYLDKDGEPKYSIQPKLGGNLIELYSCHFRICPPYGD